MSDNAHPRPLPRYQQLAEDLRHQIHRGSVIAGQQLPSLRQQAAQSGLGLNSVIRAYGELEAAGLITAYPRAGYRVAPLDEHALSGRSPDAEHNSPSPLQQRQTPRQTHALGPCTASTLTISDPAWQVMAHASDPALAPLGAAHPELDAPAVRRLYRLVRHHITHHAEHPSAYALPPGSSVLREAIATHLTNGGHPCDSEALLICQGAQQGMSLILGQLRARHGSCRIGVEAPGYFGVLAAIEANGHQAIALPTHAHTALDVEALALMLAGDASAVPTPDHVVTRLTLDALIVTPDCHNPLGGQLDLADRRRLLSLAARHDIMVIENATFAELSFETRRPWLADLKQLQSIAGGEAMPELITLCSLSKTLDPRTRCGWLWLSERDAPSPLGMQGMIRARWASGMGDMPWMHAALSELITSGDYGRHIHRMRRCYARRLASLRTHLRNELGDQVWLPPASGGYLQWCGLPNLNAQQLEQLYQTLLAAGIATLPGSLFNASSIGLRLNAAQLDDSQLNGTPYGVGEDEKKDNTLERLTTHLKQALSQQDSA
ncbi:aminotransferase-like domain-containing protein [Cobetia sp. L2A1]|uniref:aminotransferase-like domain-containing protein n=1 Tax=Cobetia sp. L2A1 TaxID=2686360 RepID=UPI00131AA93E|nr:PLP-dependent aminotransferase family protein [Cobetia sp. L2A1]